LAHRQNHMGLHAGEKLYKCSLCDKSFSDRSALCQHNDHLHSDSSPYRCPDCRMLFQSNIELKHHVCAAAALKSHQNVHSSFKQFDCGKCGRYFKYKNDVIRHFEGCSDDRLGIISLFRPHVSE